MSRFIEGHDRHQPSLLPSCVDDYVAPEALVRVVDAFVGTLDLAALGFGRTVSAATGRPGFHPGDMLRLYVWGYLNQLRSSRQLERACERLSGRSHHVPEGEAFIFQLLIRQNCRWCKTLGGILSKGSIASSL